MEMTESAAAPLSVWQLLLLGVGLVLLVEGALYALLPASLQRLMRYAHQLPVQQLRWSGLAALALGALLLWASRAL